MIATQNVLFVYGRRTGIKINVHNIPKDLNGMDDINYYFNNHNHYSKHFSIIDEEPEIFMNDKEDK